MAGYNIESLFEISINNTYLSLIYTAISAFMLSILSKAHKQGVLHLNNLSFLKLFSFKSTIKKALHM